MLPSGKEKGIYEGGKPVSDVEGISDIVENDGNITMTLGSGSYSFQGGMSGSGVDTPTLGKLEIYPNPVHDTVYVKSETEIAKIQLFSIAGVVMTEVSDANSLNMGAYPSGHYIVVATDVDGNVKIGKIIKE